MTSNMGTNGLYLNKGDFIKSLHYFENTVKRLDNIYSRLQSIYNIVLLFAWSGQYTKAKQYFDEAGEIYRKYSIPIFRRIMIRLTALLKFEVGDYEDTIEKFNELAVIDDRNNFRSYLMPYYLLISEAEMLLGNGNKAGEYLSLAENLKIRKMNFTR
jgi:tetratricopeptide (TPR) repeat protein